MYNHLSPKTVNSATWCYAPGIPLQNTHQCNKTLVFNLKIARSICCPHPHWNSCWHQQEYCVKHMVLISNNFKFESLLYFNSQIIEPFLSMILLFISSNTLLRHLRFIRKTLLVTFSDLFLYLFDIWRRKA